MRFAFIPGKAKGKTWPNYWHGPITMFMDSMVSDPQWATQFADVDLVERGTVAGPVRVVHSNFHIPISNTAAARMLFEPV